MADRAAEWVHTRVDAWRTGSIQVQWRVAVVLVLLVAASFVVSLVRPGWMPLTAFFLWLLVSRVLLSFRPLLVVATVPVGIGSIPPPPAAYVSCAPEDTDPVEEDPPGAKTESSEGDPVSLTTPLAGPVAPV